MLHVSLAEVQQWLEPTKLTVTAVDPALEASAFNVVASTLGTRYDSSGWTDQYNTPPLIRTIVSMHVAGYTYNRQYSENADVSSYGAWLVRYATTLLQQVDNKQVILVGEDADVEEFSYPAFFPTDNSTNLADPKLGGDPTDPNASPRVFSMGQLF
jgi:hypothetical protein